jgi:hypothetical protein
VDDYRDHDLPPDPDGTGGSPQGPVLPGGISLKTAATALLIVAVAAILWITFVGSAPDEPPGLATPTVRSTAVAPLSAATLPIPLTPGAAAQVGTVGAPSAQGTRVVGIGTVTVPAVLGSPSAVALATGGPPPAALAEGVFVQVTGTGPDGIRFRFGPGLTYATIRIVPDGETLRVLGGPETGDGATWWRLQDALGNIGWASQQFLLPTTTPTGWNPPAASPVIPTGSGAATTAPLAPTP